MNRSTMRSILRRHINEVTADNWTDSDLNEMLNEGLRYVARLVRRIDPDAFTYIDTINIDGNALGLYPKPTGFSGEREVAIKDSAAAQGYRPLKKVPYFIARDFTTGDESYSILGRYFFIAPIPTTAVTAGLRVIWNPVLSMSADSDVPDLHLELHMGVVLAAKILLLGETKDETKQAKDDLAAMIADVLTTENLSGPPDLISLDPADLGKSY